MPIQKTLQTQTLTKLRGDSGVGDESRGKGQVGDAYTFHPVEMCTSADSEITTWVMCKEEEHPIRQDD